VTEQVANATVTSAASTVTESDMQVL